MSDQKILVIIHGGGGAGKTTQLKKLIGYLSEGEGNGVLYSKDLSKDKMDYCYTVYPKANLAVIGKLGANQCTGLDTVYGKLGNEGVGRSLREALNNPDVGIIAIECLFLTYSWYETWVKMGLRNRFKLLFVHLEMSLWDNFRRIQLRRHKKNPELAQDYRDVFLEDTVYKNVGTKNGEARIIYQKIAGEHAKNTIKCADECYQIDAKLHPDLIFNKIINSIAKL